MNRKFEFISHKFQSRALAIEKRFIDIFSKTSKNDAVEVIEESLSMYSDLLDTVTDCYDLEKVYVFCDINPLKKIALSGDNGFLKRALSLNLPFSPEGMVFAPGIEDPMYPFGRDGVRAAMLSYMPSAVTSILIRKGKSAIFEINDTASIKKMLDLYSTEKKFAALSDFDKKLSGIIAGNTFSINNIDLWSTHLDVVDSVVSGLIKGAGLSSYVENLLSGMSVDSANNAFLENLIKNKNAKAKFTKVFEDISRGLGSQYFNLLKEIISTKKYSVQINDEEQKGISLERGIAASGDIQLRAWDTPIMSSTIKCMCLSMTALENKRQEHVEGALLTSIVKSYLEGPDLKYIEKMLESSFGRHYIAKAVNTKQSDQLFLAFGWEELSGKLSNSLKKQHVAEELGI